MQAIFNNLSWKVKSNEKLSSFTTSAISPKFLVKMIGSPLDTPYVIEPNLLLVSPTCSLTVLIRNSVILEEIVTIVGLVLQKE